MPEPFHSPLADNASRVTRYLIVDPCGRSAYDAELPDEWEEAVRVYGHAVDYAADLKQEWRKVRVLKLSGGTIEDVTDEAAEWAAGREERQREASREHMHRIWWWQSQQGVG
jgi:hypothetical protein